MLLLQLPPTSSLLPYTTLFRSVPVDIEAIEASVKKTGRCLIVHEATRTSGFGAELAALVQERRSEEHTSELQSPCNLVCRLLLEKQNSKPNETSLSTQLIAL